MIVRNLIVKRIICYLYSDIILSFTFRSKHYSSIEVGQENLKKKMFIKHLLLSPYFSHKTNIKIVVHTSEIVKLFVTDSECKLLLFYLCKSFRLGNNFTLLKLKNKNTCDYCNIYIE